MLLVKHCFDLTDDDEIKSQSRLFCIRANSVIRRFKLCDQTIKDRISNSHCTCFYSMPIWSNFKNSNYQHIRVCYNNTFRHLHNLMRSCSASGMFVAHIILSFGEIHRRNIFSFKNNLKLSTNSYIVSIVNSYQFICSPLSAYWNISLYI